MVWTNERGIPLLRNGRPGGLWIEMLLLYFIRPPPFKRVTIFNRPNKTTKPARYIILVVLLYLLILFRNDILNNIYVASRAVYSKIL
mgnify:CR=1 FL=1